MAKPSNPLLRLNPKRSRRQGEEWYPYYAGFSQAFIGEILDRLQLPSGAVVLDPWNGAGTTTAAAAARGYRTIGVDINPAMSFIAAGRFASVADLDRHDHKFLRPVRPRADRDRHEPFLAWFTSRSAAFLRALTYRAFHISHTSKHMLANSSTALTGFYFTALALTVRMLLSRELSSNPTWFRERLASPRKYDPSPTRILTVFLTSLTTLRTRLHTPAPTHLPILYTSDSRTLPLRPQSIDAVISSPPYCTRLDYPIATQPELALIGQARGSIPFRILREHSLGTPALCRVTPVPSNSWGPMCTDLLGKMAAHHSRASASYYVKTYLQYFHGFNESLGQITRVCRASSRCVLVVQSSWYKDMNVDLPSITVEMMELRGWTLSERSDFPVRHTLADTNPASRDYRSASGAIESVLEFSMK